ncbi:InlB B-repeat-containing protein, partial [Ralstonia pseudosolanacearum]|uniref:InlB B-repeat-containing protein n=1 Tax=Ralstonia pseudosolanacearum TaxID=1310165 RepID=UPI003CEFA646
MALAELEIAKTKKEIEEITAYILERQLKQDGYNVSVNSDGEVYLVTFLDSKNIYVVDKMGNVEQAERYNINYNLNGGNNPPEQPQTYQRGETVGLLYPTKEGEAFEGWYETSDFSGERITEIRNRREDITVYAKWVEETEQDYFKWSTDGTTITGLNGNTKAEIVVPKKHTLADGNVVDVTTIGASAFSGHSEITNLKLQKI